LEKTDSLKKDLEVTIKELSSTYEELSILYNLSSELIGLNVDRMVEKVLSITAGIFGYERTAIFFLEEEGDLYPKAWRGEFDMRRLLRDADTLIKALKERRTMTFCRFPQQNGKEVSILISPIIGKKREIGVLVIVQIPPKEFLSNEIKLINAITNHAGLFIENSLLYSELEELMTGSINCLIRALEASSPWTAGHTERVVYYAMEIGQEMKLPMEEMERLKVIALLHDIGKIGIPRRLLNKSGRLSEEEILTIKRHVQKAEDILLPLKPCNNLIDEIKCHHERWDGKGFFGISGKAIPLIARILAVADAFDAMTSDRPYRKRLSPEEAASEVERESGRQFDPDVVNAFMRWFNNRHHASSKTGFPSPSLNR